jgi:hypothetical protein
MEKLITVESAGRLTALGGIFGPIKTPFKADASVIIALVNSGKKVYEVNPANPKQKKLLTRTTIYSNNFTNTKKQELNQVKNTLTTLTGKTVGFTSNPGPAVVEETVDASSLESPVGVDIFESNRASSTDDDRE